MTLKHWSDVGILHNLREFLKDFGQAFRALAEVAPHPSEEFLSDL
jgi:hypothetical protein